MSIEEYLEIRRLHDEGLTCRAIARRLGIHRRKVRKALASETVPKTKRSRRASIIDEHRGWIMAKLQLYPELSAARLHHMLRDQGFTGSYTLVREAVAQLRPRLKPVYQSLSFQPGESAQVDWGVWKSIPVEGGTRRLSFFTMVLCYSRMLYAEFFFGETIEYWLSAHQNAFEYFQGVPQRVMVDNCKTAVITPKSRIDPSQKPVLNEAYATFAQHYGFTIDPCTPGRPNEKGRVEKAVAYIKSAFLAGRQASVPEIINSPLRQWLDDTANVRTHRTTLRRPADHFAESEKSTLKPLPASPHPCAAISQCVANSCCRVTVDANRYSIAPQFASQRLILHRYADRVVLYDVNEKRAADHIRCFGRGCEIVAPEHAEALTYFNRRTDQNRQISRFLSLGSAAADYLAMLKEKRVDYVRHVRQINAQRDIYGRDCVARALADAHLHGAYAADYILNLLAARSRLKDLSDLPLHVPRHADLLKLEIESPNLDIYDQHDNAHKLSEQKEHDHE